LLIICVKLLALLSANRAFFAGTVQSAGYITKGAAIMMKVRLETAAAAALAALATATLFWPQWIELALGIDPDSESGAAEWVIVSLLFMLAMGATLLARRDYRRTAMRDQMGEHP
jgi:hypothetical protein